MGRSNYTGRTPHDESDMVVGRGSQHHRWSMNVERTAQCAYCESELNLHERHVLVTLPAQADYLPAGKRHLCNEAWLKGWLGAE